MLFQFGSVYDPKLQLADRTQPVRYEISLPPESRAAVERDSLFVHQLAGRSGRDIDPAAERFVNETRMGVAD